MPASFFLWKLVESIITNIWFNLSDILDFLDKNSREGVCIFLLLLEIFLYFPCSAWLAGFFYSVLACSEVPFSGNNFNDKYNLTLLRAIQFPFGLSNMNVKLMFLTPLSFCYFRTACSMNLEDLSLMPLTCKLTCHWPSGIPWLKCL